MPGHGARDDVARREFPILNVDEEALARLVDQHRASATQGLGEERHGLRSQVDRGRVKLDEFQIGQYRAGARGERQALAERALRIGGIGEEAPKATAPSCVTSLRASTPSKTAIDGVRRTAAVRACISSWPVPSPAA